MWESQADRPSETTRTASRVRYLEQAIGAGTIIAASELYFAENPRGEEVVLACYAAVGRERLNAVAARRRFDTVKQDFGLWVAIVLARRFRPENIESNRTARRGVPEAWLPQLEWAGKYTPHRLVTTSQPVMPFFAARESSEVYEGSGRPLVYVETSIPSFYVEQRRSPEMVARRQWTCQWWDERRFDYSVYTSVAVLEELSSGNYPNKDAAVALMTGMPILEITQAIAEIVDAYIKHFLMPRGADAMHLALASYHKCDYLLTWNCNHLANARKFKHIQRVNSMLGLYVPALVTPLELLGDDADA